MLTLQAYSAISQFFSWALESRIQFLKFSWKDKPLNNWTISSWASIIIIIAIIIILRLRTMCLTGLKKQLWHKGGLSCDLIQSSDHCPRQSSSPLPNTVSVEVQDLLWKGLDNFCSSCHSCLWRIIPEACASSTVLQCPVAINNPSHEGNGSCTLWLGDRLCLLFEMQINSPGNQRRPDPLCKLSGYEFKGKLQFNDSIFLNLTQFSRIFFSKLVSRE